MSVDRGMWVRRWTAVCSLLLACTPLAGCDDGVTGPGLRSRLVVDGVTYGIASFAIAESFPVHVGVTVQIRNESDTSQSVVFPDGCVVLMRVYDSQDNLVWDLGHLVDCTQALVEVELAPGEAEDFQTGLIGAATILGETLPDGTYKVAVYLRPSGRTVELVAGTADLAIPRS